MPISIAIILAAGSGTRVWPFADARNKCAIPVANVANVRRLADSAREIGITRIVVALGAHPGSIRAALFGLNVEYVTAPADSGTAGALLDALNGVDDERFLVLYGDTCTTAANLKAIADSAESLDASGAVLYDSVPHGESVFWYGAEVENGRLTGVTGHGRDSVHRLCGVMALDRSIIPHLEANPGLMKRVQVGAMPPLEPDLAQSLNDWQADIVALPAIDYVVDIDKPWHILGANHRTAEFLCCQLTENRIHSSARINEGAEIRGFVDLAEGVEIGNRVVIEGNLIVGPNTRITNGAILRGTNIVGADSRISDYCLLGEKTIVGDNCVVGHGAEMDGVMLNGAYLWHYCEVSGVVGESVDIGAATVCGTLRFDDSNTVHRIKGRREVPAYGANETYFGDYSRTGVNVITMPGVKIGAYSCVGPGIVLTKDHPSSTLTLLKQETESKPWGPENYGW